MTTFEVQDATTQLSHLLEEVESGQEILITRNGNPVAKLVPCAPKGQRQFGTLKGVIELDDKFFDPLPEDELKLWEGG